MVVHEVLVMMVSLMMAQIFLLTRSSIVRKTCYRTFIINSYFTSFPVSIHHTEIFLDINNVNRKNKKIKIWKEKYLPIYKDFFKHFQSKKIKKTFIMPQVNTRPFLHTYGNARYF